FAAYSDNDVNSFAALSVSCLTNNPLTPDLPVKVPALTTLQVDFADSITAAQQGGKVETAKKNQARTTLVSALRQNAAYVQSVALTDLADILSTGYDVVSTNKTQSPLTTPVFALDNSFPGQIAVDLTAVVNAKSYQVQYSIGTGAWQELGIFPNTRGIIISGLTQATICNTRIRAIGGSTQYSQWGATVSAVVN
ncbi:MAG TPA: hypothetical protein VGM58_03275, partial [Verrucomicrobiae bacterium]